MRLSIIHNHNGGGQPLPILNYNTMTTTSIRLDIDLISEELYTLLISELLEQNNLSNYTIVEEIIVDAVVSTNNQ